MGPTLRPRPCARHVLPAATGQKAVVATRDDLGAIFEGYAICPLNGRPMVENLGRGVPAVTPSSDSAVHAVAGANLAERPRATIRHEDGRVASHAIAARVGASPIRVYGPSEGELGRLGDLVDDGARVD